MKKFCRKGHAARSGKQWLALLMSVCLIVMMITITVRAEESGSNQIDGSNLSWKLSEEGTLTITGTGAMPNWDRDLENAPWYSNRASIKTVVIESGVTSIGKAAFYDCTSLTSVELPDNSNFTSIEEDVFNGCKALSSITIPDSITSIGINAFAYCDNLSSVTLPNNLDTLGENAFGGCNALTEITIPAGVTMINANAFENCTSLERVTFKGEVTEIGRKAFSGCTGLTEITIPASVETIVMRAFKGCTGLTEITIPAGVTSIGSDAFNGCTGLTTVTFEGTTPPTIKSGAFSGCDNITTIMVPAESEGDYKSWAETAGLEEKVRCLYTVTVQAGDGGSASVSSGTSFGVGESVSLTYTPDKCYTLSGWEVVSGNVTVGSDNTFVMPDENVTVKALFKRSHQLTEHTEVPADYTSEGMRRYWSCSVCGAKFSDAEGTVTVTDAELVIPRLDYQIINGAESSWTEGSSEGLTIRGNGDFSKFTGVKVDGNLLDRNNYTAKEGSTIITLSTSYLNTLATGNHTVEILWTDGSASTAFTIDANTSGGEDDEPQAGDSTPIVWLFILAGLSGTGLIITGKKGRKNLET
ncbi:MAG: leucine-rich repeat protein [Butyrivibrio sp.]